MADRLVDDLKSNILHNLPVNEDELRVLSNLFIERKYPRNKILVNAGEKWDRVFYIHKGLLRLFYTDKRGRESNKGFYWEGQMVWPVAPIARTREISFSIAALENIAVSVCPFAFFQSWLKENGYWEKFALPYAEYFAEQKFLREYEFLMHSATERYRNFTAEYPDLVQRIPDYHLASYLGITNVSLSRIKKQKNLTNVNAG